MVSIAGSDIRDAFLSLVSDVVRWKSLIFKV